MQTTLFIETLEEQTKQIIKQIEELNSFQLNKLTWKANPNSWSILECIKHLNLYGEFYLPEIETKIKNSNTKNEHEFKSGILGNYFTKSILPKEKLNKMKTFKDKNPLHTSLDKTVIDQFIAQQNSILDLLKASRNISLNKVKIVSSISKLIHLKLGDTFQFIINHNLRHLKQIERIISASEE